jgi:hypothetical protein
MAVRYRDKSRNRRRCRNCPDDTVVTASGNGTVSRESEGAELWRAVLVTCGTQLELLSRYVVMGVPGFPAGCLERLYSRLGEIVKSAKRMDETKLGIEEKT